MNETFLIASRITKIRWNDDDKAQIHKFMSNLKVHPEKQAAFFNYCHQWKLAPWVWTQLKRNYLDKHLSVTVQQNFDNIHQKVKTENELRNTEAIRFLTEFKKQNIDVAILKGNLLLSTVYNETGYKKMNDFDILIHSEDWQKVQDIYFSMGYIPLGFGWSGERQKPAKFSHVGMSFISPNFKCIVGPQWGLKSPTTSYKVNIEEAWATKRNFNYFGLDVSQLSPEYNLLHLILHLGIYKCGIRDCMDIYNLLAVEDLDEEKFIEILQQSHAMEKAYFALKLSSLCCGENFGNLLDKLKPVKHTYITTRLDSRMKMFAETGDLHLSYNDYFQDIEKNVIYFNLFPKFHHKLAFLSKVIRQMGFPSTQMTLKLADISHKPTFVNKLLARLKAPYLVFALAAQEIGWLFTILLFIKLFVDLFISLKNYFVKTVSYFDYLKSINIDPDEIKRAVKNIQ